MRLIFALLVIVTHSYPLTRTFTGDWLGRTTGGQAEFSFIALSGFFIISGYLVFQSLERSSSLGDYFLKRALRIYPGLFVVLLITVLLGAVIGNLPFSEYFANRSTWTYLPTNMAFVRQQMTIDGVFTNNPYTPAINGSLWSLLYEVAFYVFLAPLFFLKKNVRLYVLGLFVALLLTATLFYRDEVGAWRLPFGDPKLVLEFGPFFFIGSLSGASSLQCVQHRGAAIAVLSSALFAAFFLHFFSVARFFVLPPLILLAGLSSIGRLPAIIRRIGDMSYGIYIYAFPIQQTWMNYFHFRPFELMAASIPVAILVGYLSWHLVEKRFLRFKLRDIHVRTPQSVVVPNA